jgi:hypothetical protein
MSPLWSDMALARAALAKVEELDSLKYIGRTSSEKPQAANTNRPVRRLLHPRLTSVAL